jgi:adenosylhomocysteine nucleosidase
VGADPGKSQAVIRRRDVWLCFALRREARWVRVPGATKLVTGMGPANTQRALAQALAKARPAWALSCGFAGGLNPRWAAGAVLFDASETPALAARLVAAGAHPARFCSVAHVVVTAAQKRALHQATGADAAEMEAEAVRAVCRSLGLPSATVRAISDPADADLPVDFNRFMTNSHRLDYIRLLIWLATSPSRLKGVLRLRRQCRLAARNLGEVLTRALAGDWLDSG